MSVPAPRRSERNLARASVRNEVMNKTVRVSLTRIPSVPIIQRPMTAGDSSTLNSPSKRTIPSSRTRKKTNVSLNSPTNMKAISAALNPPQEDDLYWQDKIDTLDYCVICLERNAATKDCDDGFSTMEHIWPYLKVSNIFSDYLFIVGKANDGIYMESKIPPMCRPCLDDMKTLNSLHLKINEINQRIKERAITIRRKMEGVNFKTISAKLEGDMAVANLPFRCMSNAIQFLSQLHRPSRTRGTPSPRKRCRQIIDNGRLDSSKDSAPEITTPQIDLNSLKTEDLESENRFATNFHEDDNFIYECDDMGVDNSIDDVDYHPSADGKDPLNETAKPYSKQPANAKASESEESSHQQNEKGSKKENSCPVCGVFYTKKEKLRVHWWVKHKKNELKEEEQSSASAPTGSQFNCQKCGAKYKHYPSLLFHHDHEKEKCQAQVESRERSFCLICEKHFNSRRALIKHRTREHHTSAEDIQKLVCKICDKAFKKVGHLEAHMLEHSKPPKTEAEKGGVCEICGKVFLAKKSLEQHKSVHTGEKPFICNMCGKAFRRSSFLHVHQRTIHYVEMGQSRPVCAICSKDFSCQKYLKEHMVLHGQGRTFTCDDCGRVFRKRTNMNAHRRRVHLVKKEHQLSHDPETGKRRPACKICSKTFSNKRNIAQHVKNVHQRKFKFSCDICDLKFPSKYELRYHNLELHVKPLVSDSNGPDEEKLSLITKPDTQVDTGTGSNIIPSAISTSCQTLATSCITLTPVFFNDVKDSPPIMSNHDEIIDGHQLIAEITIEHTSVETVDQSDLT